MLSIHIVPEHASMFLKACVLLRIKPMLLVRLVIRRTFNIIKLTFNCCPMRILYYIIIYLLTEKTVDNRSKIINSRSFIIRHAIFPL